MRRLLPIALALLAASCGGAPAPGALDPAPLLDGAVAAMAAVESARFEMTHEGAPVTVEGLEFDGAVGRYGAPASAEAVLRVRAGDIAVEMGVRASGASLTWT